MKKEDSATVKTAKVLTFVVGMTVIVRFLIYIYVALCGIGKLPVGSYMGIIMNFLMYANIAKYTWKYFIKKEDGSLESMLFRYGIALLSNLISLKNGNEILFACTAVMVFLVPYLSGHLDKTKKAFLIFAAVLVLSVVVSYINVTNPVENAISVLGSFIYSLDAINPTVEWLLFGLLYVARVLLSKEQSTEENVEG